MTIVTCSHPASAKGCSVPADIDFNGWPLHVLLVYHTASLFPLYELEICRRKSSYSLHRAPMHAY